MFVSLLDEKRMFSDPERFRLSRIEAEMLDLSMEPINCTLFSCTFICEPSGQSGTNRLRGLELASRIRWWLDLIRKQTTLKRAIVD